MPFVQRVVQPTYLARSRPAAANAAASGSAVSKFQCTPGKCNNNCISPRQHSAAQEREAAEKEFSGVARTPAATTSVSNSSNNNHHYGDKQFLQKTRITALVHEQPTPASDVVDSASKESDFAVAPLSLQCSHAHNLTNGFAASFSYATDTEEESPPPPLAGGVGVGGDDASALLPMKKLKQHVEFLSATSPSSSSPARSAYAGAADSALHTDRSHQRRQQQLKSPTAAKITPGYEFDSISNITLSNALRQLASLVLLASDIFDDLQQELQNIGDRSLAVQRKITAVGKKVCAFDPKMVTVPESDLLTFAQRKAHYESDKSVRKELFTAETRPRSVRVLYEDAGKACPPPLPTAASAPFACASHAGAADDSRTGASQAAGSDELVCTPVFGKANRKMRTRIDAEIEIRLPAAIEDLRKWTSTEALGDVTVTPDCMHHVDTSINTSVMFGDNGLLTPALSPSVLSADAVDALYSVNLSSAQDNSQIPNDINKDVPLNHRLPSPEEQCKIIALRYPAEVISVDTSGKRFERMCLARKSTTGCVLSIAESNNLNDDVHTVSRRSRSRKVRGKRRNTIAGTDQKEIQDAASGDATATSSESKHTPATAAGPIADDAGAGPCKRGTEKSKKFGRSKSSDVLKKESVALPYDKGKNTLTRLNSLKQWGRNRFRFMQRSEAVLSPIDDDGRSPDTSSSSQNTALDKSGAASSTPAGNKANKIAGGSSSSSAGGSGAGGHLDEEGIIRNRTGQKSEGRFSHERKPSYSSSEKSVSVSVSSSGQLKGKLHLATCSGNVKLRDTSSLNRQRRNGITATDIAGKDEQPHSSSGNWSASSESGRASIGSEITIQPKSSASNTSLNVSSFHPGSGPPSSMLSRRRFLNTSASSSVTSEGTTTPDLQVSACDAYNAYNAYNNHLDDETSSAYSCDTEGYYTSFHMDSGLRTLKEEEPPMTPLPNGQSNGCSFGSQSNQTMLSAENEYELYGRGSTSTTTSSAGTVCTTLMANEHSSLNAALGPDVPERSSSLVSACSGKLNRSSHSNSNSNSTSTLERSYSSSTIGSTIGSTLERTGTIKRNMNAGLKLTVGDGDGFSQRAVVAGTPDSQEDEFDFGNRMRKRAAQPLPSTSSVVAELDFSESSDLEGVERIERIKQKTAINAKRIPSMCIITPTTSDDENHAKDAGAYDPTRAASNGSSPCSKAAAKAEKALQLRVDEVTGGYCKVEVGPGDSVKEVPLTATKSAPHSTSKKLSHEQVTPLNAEQPKDHNLNLLAKRGSQYGFNHMLEKLKVVLPNIKRSPSKNSPPPSCAVLDADELYDTAGEYVTIADISNNNRHGRPQQSNASSGLGIYYSNDTVRRLQFGAADDSAAKADEPLSASRRETTEYISLNELPHHLCGRIASGDAAFGADDKGVRESYTSALPRPPSPPPLLSDKRECAESDSGQSVPMYAEITEQHERTLIPASAQSGGARIKLNAQGRIVYESDSLRRRKGAHTTFAPGPCVKETESALAANTARANAEAANSESAYSSSTARLLLLNNGGGGGVNTRKFVNVRPTIATNDTCSVTSAAAAAAAGPTVLADDDEHSGGCTGNNQLHLMSHVNPLLHTGEASMLPSPSAKSTTSSTGSSTISSTNSATTHASSSSSASSAASASSARQPAPPSKDEVYQPFYKLSDQRPSSPSATPFPRNGPVYWTLQSRKQPKSTSAAPTCRDDLYATPIRRSERAARAAAVAASANSALNISPIVARNRSSSVGFLTSTPTKPAPAHSADNIFGKQRSARSANWNDDSPERLNTCADRIGHSKTSLMDFKRLLLAKSVKSNPVQKVSAVEMLKKSNVTAANSASPAGSPTPPSTAVASLNSSMKVLDLSGSPKTFANRRMLRHGQFGSPSKSFAPKTRTSSGGWRSHNVVQRTDIMSTTIPEVNSEEDQSSSAASSSDPKSHCAPEAVDVEERLQMSAAERFDLKRNFFLQTEENNFMRGELRKAFLKTSLQQDEGISNQTVAAAVLGVVTNSTLDVNAVGGRAAPALETAL